MTVKNITSFTEWKALVDTGAPVVVDFHGESWCVPCRRFSPTFTKVADERPDITFVKVDVDVADAEFKNDFDFMSVPSVFIVNDNQITQVDAVPGTAFLRKVNEHVPNGDSA